MFIGCFYHNWLKIQMSWLPKESVKILSEHPQKLVFFGMTFRKGILVNYVAMLMVL